MLAVVLLTSTAVAVNKSSLSAVLSGSNGWHLGLLQSEIVSNSLYITGTKAVGLQATTRTFNPFDVRSQLAVFLTASLLLKECRQHHQITRNSDYGFLCSAIS
ncbi:hypothetical protein C8R11_11227 [Nitrosomonas aestuarii]|nr:hypothetical protein C8R11_11227 [Nitrosomonas aestuarii]